MPISLGSNISSLATQRRLGQTTGELSRVFQRLSSGLRIVHASDDAAGLAIATDLNTQSRILTQALKNVNDGISTLSVADGGLQALNNLLTRQKELAEQAANGTYSNVQRSALQREVNQLTNEFNRIVSVTEFNGQKLLDGSTSSITVAAGTNNSANSLINVDLSNLLSFSATGTMTPQTATSGTIEQDSIDFSTTMVGAMINFHVDSVFNLAVGAYMEFYAADGMGGEQHYYVWLDSGGVPDPTLGGTSIRVPVLLTDTATDVVNKVVSEITTYAGGYVTASAGGSDTVTIQNLFAGPVTDANFGTLGGDPTITLGQIVQPGAYFEFSTTAHDYFVWFNDGGTSPPTVPGRAPIMVTYSLDWDSATLAAAARTAIQTAAPEVTATISGGTTLVIAGSAVGAVNAPTDINSGIYPYRDVIGTNSMISTGLDTITAAGHGYVTGQSVTLTTTGVLPTGLSTATTYYIIAVDQNTIKLASSLANATNGTAIDITGNGSGVMTLTPTSTGPNGTSTAFLPALDISTAAAARNALNTITTQFNQVEQAIASIGSSESRLDTATKTIESLRASSIEAASRIMDTDVASDAAILVKQQLLQRAAASILAQANQLPALALKLLNA